MDTTKTKRASPAHPPFKEMVSAAIQSSSLKTGASRQGISSHRNYFFIIMLNAAEFNIFKVKIWDSYVIRQIFEIYF